MSFEFTQYEKDEILTLEQAVGQALGAASVCWENLSIGAFDSTRMMEIAEALIEFVKGDAPF